MGVAGSRICVVALVTESPGEIRKLPPALVNQIAAGEVIERPASVVKELVENALDAGATRIEVTLERGGIDLIEVADDGRGIPRDELALAVEPHATSKIREQGDLDRIATMGFRGEALASIGSIARLRIRSRVRGSGEAWRIDVDGGELGEVTPDSGPEGTRITVRSLFFSTPARRKFLRTPRTEQGRCLDWVRSLAMGRPDVGFRVLADGREIFAWGTEQGPRARALELLGRELESQLLEVRLDEFDDTRGMSIWGLAGLPSLARATNQAQFTFINGRVVRDKTIQHAIREAYRGLIDHGRHPTAVLMLEMAPGALDVNVHPAKLEVRFRDQSMVHQAVLRCVRDALRSADLTPSAEVGARWGGAGDPLAILAKTDPPDALAIAELLANPRPEMFGPRGVDRIGPVAGLPTQPRSPLDALPEAIPAQTAPPPDPENADLPTFRRLDGALQVHQSYLVTQDAQGMVIIDQHALHERVMFEKLRTRVQAGPLESQTLLTPAVVPAAASRFEALEKLSGLLTRLGIEAEAIGPKSIGVRAFPTLLFERGVDPVRFMEELLDEVTGWRDGQDVGETGAEAAMHEVLDMMACKAAVKAGDALRDDEIAELLRLREQVERSSNCPHGRPTTVRITIRQLEKLFGRS